MTPFEMADKLERIANAITHTVYNHGTAISKGYNAERQVSWDDADILREMAKELRGPSGQFAHDVGRASLPWEAP